MTDEHGRSDPARIRLAILIAAALVGPTVAATAAAADDGARAKADGGKHEAKADRGERGHGTDREHANGNGHGNGNSQGHGGNEGQGSGGGHGRGGNEEYASGRGEGSGGNSAPPAGMEPESAAKAPHGDNRGDEGKGRRHGHGHGNGNGHSNGNGRNEEHGSGRGHGERERGHHRGDAPPATDPQPEFPAAVLPNGPYGPRRQDGSSEDRPPAPSALAPAAPAAARERKPNALFRAFASGTEPESFLAAMLARDPMDAPPLTPLPQLSEQRAEQVPARPAAAKLGRREPAREPSLPFSGFSVLALLLSGAAAIAAGNRLRELSQPALPVPQEPVAPVAEVAHQRTNHVAVVLGAAVFAAAALALARARTA